MVSKLQTAMFYKDIAPEEEEETTNKQISKPLQLYRGGNN